MEEFELALDRDPDYAQAEVNLAYVLRALGWRDRAIETAESALAKDPGLADGWNVLGLVYMDRERYDLAAERLGKAVEVSPAYGDAWFNLGLVYVRQHRIAEGLDAFLRGAAGQPNHVRCLTAAGRLYFEMGPEHREKAKNKFKRALDFAPLDYEANLGLGRVYLAGEKFEEAIAHTRTAYGVEHADRRGTNQAEQLFDEICAKAPDRLATTYCDGAKAKVEEASAGSAANRRAELHRLALEDLSIAERIDPTRADVKTIQADILLLQDKVGEALGRANAAVLLAVRAKDRGLQAQALYTRASVQVAKKDWEAAEADARQCARLDPKSAKAHNLLGVIYLDGLRQYRKEARAWKTALRLDPANEQAKANLAQLRRRPGFAKADDLNGQGIALLEAGDPAEAQDRFAQACQFDPDFAEALSNWALCLIEKGDLAAAWRKVEQALAEDPDLGAAHDLKGILLLRGGRPADVLLAEAELRIAAELLPGEADPQANLGFLYLERKEHDKARAAFEIARQTDPDHYRSQLGLGRLYRELGLFEDAETVLTYAIGLKPRLVDARLELARVYVDQRRFAEASATLEEAAGLAPDDPELLVAQADAHAALGANGSAVEKLLEAADRFARRQNYGGAVGALSRAAELAPADANVLTEYGGALLLIGETAAAVKHLRRALGLDAKRPRAWYLLGNAYDAMEEKRLAFDAYGRGIAQNPKNVHKLLEARAALHDGSPGCPESREQAVLDLRRALATETDPEAIDLIRESLEKLEKGR